MSHYYKNKVKLSSLQSTSNTIKKLKLAMFICLAFLVLLNFFIRPHSPHFIIDSIPGFWAFFGMGVSIVLGWVAKGVAHIFLGKNEDFWNLD